MAESSPFLRQLTNSDARTRTAALDNLRTFLTAHKKIDNVELLKLWKGLFYAMWHSDRPRTQQTLARDLADLVQVVGKDNAFAFLEAFWITIAREWGGIDALRMDKFLYLIRLYLRASLQQVANDNYHESAIAEYNRLISSVPLSPVDPKVPDGLRYHVLDIYVDELDAVGVLAKRESIPFDSLLEPVNNIIKNTKNKTVRKRAKETLADERIVGTVTEGDETSNDAVAMETDQQDEEWNGVED